MSIDDSVIATAPDPVRAAVRQWSLSPPPAAVLAGGGLRTRLPVADLDRPAALAYLDAAEFAPAPASRPAEPRDIRYDGLRRFLPDCDAFSPARRFTKS